VRVRVSAVGRAEPDQHLVEHHVVADLDAGCRGQPVGEPGGQVAAPLDQVGDAGPAQRLQRGVDRQATPLSHSP
jgi:hypothetical protein